MERKKRTIRIIAECTCGYAVEATVVNKGLTTVICDECKTEHDLSGSVHSYKKYVCACDELVKLGCAEATRECNKHCKRECDKCQE